MEGFDLARRLTAEALGTALLVAAVIGSVIMADRLLRWHCCAIRSRPAPFSW
jgi:glycerol uptake facilitator-like aquaporin